MRTVQILLAAVLVTLLAGFFGSPLLEKYQTWQAEQRLEEFEKARREARRAAADKWANEPAQLARWHQMITTARNGIFPCPQVVKADGAYTDTHPLTVDCSNNVRYTIDPFAYTDGDRFDLRQAGLRNWINRLITIEEVGTFDPKTGEVLSKPAP
jgi:hypothetical protein